MVSVRGMVALMALGVVGVLGACAPRGLPAGWPAEWGGRGFSDEGVAYVYAKRDAARDEAAAIAARLAGRFQQAAGKPPAKGVIVVVDQGEEPPVVDAQLQQAGTDLLKDIGANAGSAQSPAMRRVMERAGGLARLVAAGSWGRRLEFASDVPEPIRAGAPYVLVLPSSRATIGAFDDAVRGVLAETGAGWAERAALKAAIDLARPDFLGTVRDLHRRSVIATMVGSDAALAPEQRSRLDALVAELTPRSPTQPTPR